MLLSTAYLGNIRYYSKFLMEDSVIIEAHENYQKQSYRNRCRILTANGIADLTVPVIKNSGVKIPIKEVRIDYGKNWQHQHWYSIMSAYKNSPYYDYYFDTFEPFFRKKYKFLWDLNEELRAEIFKILEINCEVRYSETFENSGGYDLRNAISPKGRLNAPDPHFRNVPYYQVFSEKYDFFPGLSIIDLLFCEGPNSVEILRESTK